MTHRSVPKRGRSRARNLCHAALAAAAASPLLLPATVNAARTWTNADLNDSWLDNNNWNPVGQPTQSDDVTFPFPLTGGHATVNIPSGVQSSQSLTFNAAYSLTGSGLVNKTGIITIAPGVTATVSADLNSNMGFHKTGPGSLILNPSVAYAYQGPVSIESGVLSINSNSNFGFITNNVTIYSVLETRATMTTARSFTFASSAVDFGPVSGTSLTMSGPLSGNGDLVMNGLGTLVLSGNNTFTGGVYISSGLVSGSGTVSVNADNRLGAAGGLLLINGGTFRSTASFATSSRPVTIHTHGGTVDVPAAGVTLTFNGIVGGTGSGLTKTGSGTLVLAGNSANTFSGLVTVANGTLRLAKSTGNAIANNVSIGDGTGTNPTLVLDANEQIASANLNVFGDGIFNLNGFNETIGSLSMSAGTVNGNGGTLTLSAGPVTTFSGPSLLNTNINLGGASRTFSIANGIEAVDCLISGVVSNGSLFKSGAGTLQLGAANTYTGSTGISGGAMIFDQSLTTSSLTITLPNASIKLAPANALHVIKTGALSDAGKLDLTDNKLITTSAVGTLGSGNTYTGVTGLIQSGRNGGNWSGLGIVTSQTTATTSNLTSLGIATAQQAKSLATATTTATWAGQTITGSDTLVTYTYGGDANLDGKINVDDYGRIDLNANVGTAGWFNGDFNYDGKVNVDDYGIIDFNIGIQGAPFPTGSPISVGLSAASSVPEPVLTLPLLLPLTLTTRRRRHREESA